MVLVVVELGLGLAIRRVVRRGFVPRAEKRVTIAAPVDQRGEHESLTKVQPCSQRYYRKVALLAHLWHVQAAAIAAR